MGFNLPPLLPDKEFASYRLLKCAMAGVRKSSRYTRSGALAGILSAESCHLVLESSPPDYVKKISRYLESSVGRDGVCDEIAAADSDSGDSLFLTQKQVPEAVRSGRRERLSLRSKPVSPRDLEGSDAGSLSSDSHEEPKTAKDERYKIQTPISSLPKFSFPFLSGRKLKGKARSTGLSNVQNKALHNSAMGGFFKCLIEGYERGHDAQSSLPTVDVEGQDISPLSEEEKEEDEDIKVVERKRFVVLSKATRQQTWGSLKQQMRKADNPGQETPHGGRLKATERSVTRGKPLSADADGCHGGESNCGAPVERERNEQRVISGGNILARREKKNGRHAQGNGLFQQSATEEELCDDSDATVCEPPEPQRSPRHGEHAEEESEAAAEPQTVVSHTGELSQTEDEPESQSLLRSLPDIAHDTNNDEASDESGAKKRKKKRKDKGALESVEEEMGQSQGEPERLHAAAREAAGLSEDNRAGPPAAQSSDELEFNGRNCIKNSQTQEGEDTPDSKPKKKRRKKDKSLADYVGQEGDGNSESDVRTEEAVRLQSGTAAEAPNVEDAAIKKKTKKRKGEALSQDGDKGVDVSLFNGAVTSEERMGTPVKKKKKKKKTVSDEAEDVDDAQETTEGLEDQTTELVNKKKKKKKKKKKISEGSGWNITDDNATQSDDSVSVREKEKRATPSFLVADAKENSARRHGKQNSPPQSVGAEKTVGAGDFETESAEVAGNLEESNDGVRKKKEKRKVKVEEDGVETNHGQDFEAANKIKEKKTRRRNESESTNPVERFQNAADEGYPPTDEDAAVKKKKKKKKCHVTATEDVESERSASNTCRETPGNQASNEMRDGKNLLEGKASIKAAELKPHENKKKRKKERNEQSPDPSIIRSSPMLSETLMSLTEKPSQDRVMKNKHAKVKRTLLNLSDGFL